MSWPLQSSTASPARRPQARAARDDGVALDAQVRPREPGRVQARRGVPPLSSMASPLTMASTASRSGRMSCGWPAALIAALMSFRPLPVMTTSAVASRGTMPAATAARRPATPATPAGSPNTAAEPRRRRIASRISSSSTATIVPRDARIQAAHAASCAACRRRCCRRWCRTRTAPRRPFASNARTIGLAPSAWTPSMPRHGVFTRPRRLNSCRPLAMPPIVQPSPTDTTTQSGSAPPSRRVRRRTARRSRGRPSSCPRPGTGWCRCCGCTNGTVRTTSRHRSNACS